MTSSRKNKIDGDLFVSGRLVTGAFTTPDDSIGNEHIVTDDPIDSVKLEQQYNVNHVQSASGTTAVAETRTIHVSNAAGEVDSIRAGVVDACVGDATITVDLRKNGTSVLSSTITIDEDSDDYDTVEGTPDGTDSVYSEMDVFEIVITVAAGTGTLGKGLFVQVIFREGAE